MTLERETNKMMSRCMFNLGFSRAIISRRISYKYRILPMPKLSPSMTQATINKWFITTSSEVKSYQLALEITAKDLTEETNGGNNFHVMDVEILEDMFVAKLIGEEGKVYKVGEPIALFCEERGDIENAAKVDVDLCKDAYCYANGTQMVLWQAFVKDTGNIRCSCG